MLNIQGILAALFLSTSALTPSPSTEPFSPSIEMTESEFILGKERVGTLRAAYEAGEYAEFLDEMESSYQEALQNSELAGLIEMRQKEIPADFQSEWQEKFADLQRQKNRDLLEALSDRDSSLFADKVRSLAAQVSTPEQEKAIGRLEALTQMAPQSGANEDENRLIDIDLEYEYKTLHAAMPLSVSSQQQDYQIVLRMEKMSKMAAAAKSFQDHDLKQAVGLAAANLDARLARNLDGADLNAFVKGKKKASNETEEKVSQILSHYQAQFADLMRDLAEANR